MASLLVLVAHSGRTLQLDVQPSTRVDAVQLALVSFTGIPVADQIAMYQGARLDPAKHLGAYRLPVDPAVAALEDHPMFLYCKSYLKPGAALPPPEALATLHVQVPPLAEVNLTHPLHSAPSPLVRALPDYERHFQHHLATTRAYWDVAQSRLQRCRQLLSEQEVQARAADAARANVEAHYNYILNSYQTFLDKYIAQHASHSALLATFPSDLAALEAIELHPALQPQQHQQPQEPQQQQNAFPPLPVGGAAGGIWAAPGSTGVGACGGGPRRLAELYPMQRLREWAETCSRSHASFGAKVSDLEALFQLLRKDVEGLFMQAPSVDLDALGRQMSENEALLDEHSSMVQVLSKDLRTVRTLVEDVVRQLGSGAGGGGLRQGGLHDAAAAMESIHETHRNRVLPRLAQLDGQLAAFASRVEASKVAMSRDVLGQLQRISGQQSRIRDMKNKLAAFHEVLARQDAAFAELRVVHRLPFAYRALLAEVVRRSAWHQLYCGQAGRLAEHMARFRDKESGRRATFSSQVARYIPADLLGRTGLSAEPPHCIVTVPPPDVPLISVAMADLQRLSYLDERVLAASANMRASTVAPPLSAPSVAMSLHQHHHNHHQHQQQQHAHRVGISDPASSVLQHSQQQHQHLHTHQQHQQQHTPYSQSQASSRLAGAASLPFPGTIAVLDADAPPPTDSANALEMENARLRAELANHIAAACIRELSAATDSGGNGGGGGSGGSSERLQQSGTTIAARSADTSVPPQPSTSAANVSQQRVFSEGGAGGGGGGGGVLQSSVVAAPRRDPAEVLSAMQRALGMKDDLIRHQQREITALGARSAAYEERITALEALLTQRATGTTADVSLSTAVAVAAVRDEGGASAVRGFSDVQELRRPSGALALGQEGSTCTNTAGMVVTVAGSAGDKAATEGLLGKGQVSVGGLEAVSANRVEDPGRGKGGTAAVVDGLGVTSGGGEDLVATVPKPPVTSGNVGGDVDDVADVETSTHIISPFSQVAQKQGKQPRKDVSGGVDAAAPTVPTRSLTFGDAGPANRASLAAPATIAAADGGGTPATITLAIPKSGSAQLLQGSQQPMPQPQQLTTHRGSSGPQAIPLSTGGLRRGGDNSDDDEAEVLYGSPRVPMSIGSLPFATSLPVGSMMVSRLASSPSVGIGLGLALGFGLTEGMSRRPSAVRELGEGDHYHTSSSSTPSKGDREGASTGSSAGGRAGLVGEGQLRESRDGSQGRVAQTSSGISSGSSGLQFQPSWSVPVSGDSGTGVETLHGSPVANMALPPMQGVSASYGTLAAAASGHGGTAGTERRQDLGGSVYHDHAGGGGGVSDDSYRTEGGCSQVEKVAEEKTQEVTVALHLAASRISQKPGACSAGVAAVAPLGEGRAVGVRRPAAVAVTTEVVGQRRDGSGGSDSRDHSAVAWERPEGHNGEHGGGEKSDDVDSALHEDVPDIDEVFDSNGAWEGVAFAATRVEATVLGRGGDGSGEPRARGAAGVKAGADAAAGGTSGGLVAGVETSSGYESVGSTISAVDC